MTTMEPLLSAARPAKRPIHEDAPASDAKRAKIDSDESEQEDDSIEDDESEGTEGSLKDFIVKEESDALTEEEDETKSEVEDIDELKTEASRFVPEVLGKRVPKVPVRYGVKEEAAMLEKFIKKDIIDHIAVLAKDPLNEEGPTTIREAFEASGKTWPKLTMRNSLEDVKAAYADIKSFAEIPDSDDEEEEDEDDDESDDDDEESEDDEEETEEDDEDDEDDEDEEDDEDDEDE